MLIEWYNFITNQYEIKPIVVIAYWHPIFDAIELIANPNP